MKASEKCINCIIEKADNLFCKFVNNEKERLEFKEQILDKINSYGKNVTAPFLNSKIMDILQDKVKINDLYLEEKKFYNEKILLLEEQILTIINKSEDKLLSALKYSMVGNFIDFGAMKYVDDKLLDKIINTALKQNINSLTYKKFKQEILNSNRLCYIVDNCGEAVFDKMFIKIIKEYNKNINVDIIVRGKPALNDVTYKEAIEIGMNKYGNIIENGTNIPGTDLSQVNEETKNSIDKSDLIIAKGQGNFETLFGSNKNIYYVFLCKCDMFVERFSINRYEGVFLNEKFNNIKF